MSAPVAVVLGLRENGLGMVRALGRQGVPVIAVDDSLRRFYAKTRYARVVACKDFNGVGLVDELCRLGESLSAGGVLVPTMDRNVTLLSQHRERLESAYRHSLPDPDVVDVLMDKGATRHYAEAHGFLMPKSFEVTTEAELESHLVELEPPYILKPQFKSLGFFRYTPRKVFFTRSPDEVRRAFRLILQWEPGAVLQEWIPGADSNLVFGLYYFDENSDPLACFLGRKIRQYIPYCGTGCSAEPWNDEFVAQHGVRFFREINYTGYAAIEFKISDRDGKYYLVEPSIGRTEHLFALAAANNVNLPYIGYRHMIGQPVPALDPPRSPARYVHFRNDLKAARAYMRADELTVAQWLRSLRGRKQWAFFARDDPRPFLAYALQPLARIPKGVARRTLRVVRRLYESRAQSGSQVPDHPLHDSKTHVDGALDWLCRAQDTVTGGGVARGYGNQENLPFPPGWQPAYPETTGYIIPTLFDAAQRFDRADLRDRAIRMAEWETEVQLPDGAIPGGVVGEGKGPVVFNTGQVILGWCRAFEESGDTRYREALTRAGEFLVRAQDPDGAWRRFTTGDGLEIVHAYDVRVSWALLRAHLVTTEQRFLDAAIRNIEFTLTLQQQNGWFRSNDLQPKTNAQPLTHTIAYTTRGILECGVLLNEDRYVRAARTAADALRRRLNADGFLAGRLNSDWADAVPWCCLTGSAQTSVIWLKLYGLTGDGEYLDASTRINRYLKRAQDLTSDDEGIRGGIAGCYPVAIGYNRHQILNWATKFFVDALLLADSVTGEG